MPKKVMPEVDRVAAGRAAIAARQSRAALKDKIRRGEITPSKVLALAREADNAAATLRLNDLLLALPGIGQVKAQKISEQLQIALKRRLGGLGRLQRERLSLWLTDREGLNAASKITVLAGPTAVGKGTVVAYLKQHYPEVKLSVSATTRPPRPGEVHGEHYYFVTDEEFDRMLAHNELLEWATVHGVHRYGTPRTPLIEAAAAGYLVLLEIDLQGARQVRIAEPNAKLIFLAPPSWEELVNRLTGRATETKAEQDRRLATAKVELAAANEFDHVIVNDRVERAAAALISVMRGSTR